MNEDQLVALGLSDPERSDFEGMHEDGVADGE